MTTTDDSHLRPRRTRHVARSARILSTGLSTTAILGITAAFGAADRAQSAADEPTATTPTTAVSQLPSPEGTIVLPTGKPAPVRIASAPPQPAPTAPIDTAPVTVVEAIPATVAPIAPAEPPVELTLPPAPSNGSSGGSR